MSAILFSCTKETMVNADSIAGETNASVTGDGSGENGGNGGDSNGGEDTTPVEAPEFIDNNDWSAYDENEYLIGFGAVDENTAPQEEGEKATIDLSERTVVWNGKDRATVYVPATGASGTYAYDATRQQFRPASPNDIVAIGNNLAYVYYPASLFQSYSSDAATVTMPGPVAMDSVSDLGEKLPMSGIIPANQGKAYPTVTFKNLCSILRVQLTGCEKITSVTLSNTGVALAGDNAGSVSWNEGTPTLAMSGDTKSVTVSCGEGGLTLNESTPTEFYFLLPSSGTMSSMKVRVNFTQSDDTDDTYEYTPYIEKTRASGLDLSSKRSKIIKLAFRAGFFSGGDGSAAHPYEIKTADDFQALGTYTTGTTAQYGYNSTAGRNYFRSTVYYKQTADINLSGKTLGPIGSATYPFYASYDGDSHTISNASITNNSTYVALFGYCNGGTVENLTVSGTTITNTKASSAAAAVLVGNLNGGGLVNNCTAVSSTISGESCGGVVGYLENGSITDCVVRGLTATASGSNYCGGVVGRAKTALVENCILYGAASDGTGTASSISGAGRVGGIVGTGAYDSGTTTVRGCYVSNASISSTGDYVGGQVGYMYAGGAIDGKQGDDQALYLVCGTGGSGSQGAVTVSSTTDCVGGLVGYNAGTVQGYKVTGKTSYIILVVKTGVTGRNNVGGLVGKNVGDLHTCYVNNTTVFASQNAVGGIAGYSETGTLTDCLTRYMTITSYNEDLDQYGYNVGGVVGRMESGTINLSAYTAANGTSNKLYGHNSIGGVVGLMRGGSLTGSTSYAAASESTLQALRYNASQTPGNIGGVVGKIDVGPATITNCKAESCSITSMVNAGGILGFLYDDYDHTPVTTSKILNCSVSSMTYTITNSSIGSGNCSSVGGIVGQMTSGTVEKCRNGSNLSAPAAYYVGGIVGNLLGGTVHLCYSAGSATVTGHSRVGGLVGIANSSKAKILIINSASRSAVTSTSYESEGSFNCSTGGLVGRMQSSTQDCVMANCVGLGSNVLKNSDTSHNCICIGGIVGYAKDVDVIRNCYSQRTDATMKYKNSTNVPTAAGSKYGGIYGHLDGTSNIWDCYSQTTAVGVAGGSTTSVNNQKVASTVVTSNGKLQATLYSGTKFTTDTYFRIVLAFGASTATSGTVAENNLVVYTGSSGETFKMSNWTRPEADAVPAYPLPNKLYNLGTDYYSN